MARTVEDRRPHSGGSLDVLGAAACAMALEGSFSEGPDATNVVANAPLLGSFPGPAVDYSRSAPSGAPLVTTRRIRGPTVGLADGLADCGSDQPTDAEGDGGGNCPERELAERRPYWRLTGEASNEWSHTRQRCARVAERRAFFHCQSGADGYTSRRGRRVRGSDAVASSTGRMSSSFQGVTVCSG
jgi:hypothetical protein